MLAPASTTRSSAARSSFTVRPFTSAYRCATSKARLSRACQMAPTDDPGVVAGRHIDCITGAVLDLGTVVHLHDHAPFKDIAGVRRLA